jgi:asparagine synthase (glutamine-hydrolysing)
MTHRGPDDRGTWLEEGVGLGHTRLSIIDLSSAAHQPMTNDDSSVVLTFNGEIYNFPSLRRELTTLGYGFRSTGDTEVLLRCYQEWGLDCLSRLDGMFAFAVWDARQHRLVVARDRFGIKPVYYAAQDGRLAFASEAKALLRVWPKLAVLDERALAEHLRFRSVSGSRTLLRGVSRLLPGHYLTVANGAFHCVPFWQWTPEAEGEAAYDLCPAVSDVSALESALTRSVEQQLVSDVPLGTLCSGGLDSSLVTALAARSTGRGLHTFTVSFPGHAGDESCFARQTAESLQTDHHELRASAEQFAADLPLLSRLHDEPIAHENSVFVFEVSRLARSNGVKVLLTGEGADELFCGYSHHYRAVRAMSYRWFRKLGLASAASRFGNLSSPSRCIRRATGLFASEDWMLLNATAFMSSSLLRKLTGDFTGDNIGHRQSVLDVTRGLPFEERLRAMDIATYLPPILMRQDKMSMAASVESRVPFLGDDVAAWALACPAREQLNGHWGKTALRTIGPRYLPPEIVTRPKVGFGVPTSGWFRSSQQLRELLQLTVAPDARIAALLDTRLVGRMLREHDVGRKDWSREMWVLLSLEIWMREVLGHADRAN